MTEENDGTDVSEDITDALNKSGIDVPDDGADEPEQPDESDDGAVSGLISRITELSGTGKSLDSYENDPIASVFDKTEDGEPTHKGAKHIARGIDGLSPLAATNPLIDIIVGFVLLGADAETDGAILGDGSGDGDSAREREDGGEMLT